MWDAAGVAGGKAGVGVVLVEAKAHAGELRSPRMKTSSYESDEQIRGALDETKVALGVDPAISWTGTYYQFASRLALLHYVRVRCKQPAWLITTLNHPLIDGRLTELSAGPFEGIRFSDLESGADKTLCAAYAQSTDESNPVFPEGAESLQSSTARSREFLREIEMAPGRHFAASHGSLIRILLCEFLGLDARYYIRLKVDNCHAALIKFFPRPPTNWLA